jgi:hypothetical protein
VLVSMKVGAFGGAVSHSIVGTFKCYRRSCCLSFETQMWRRQVLQNVGIRLSGYMNPRIHSNKHRPYGCEEFNVSVCVIYSLEN